jgi:hypothetical protein
MFIQILAAFGALASDEKKRLSKPSPVSTSGYSVSKMAAIHIIKFFHRGSLAQVFNISGTAI